MWKWLIRKSDEDIQASCYFNGQAAWIYDSNNINHMYICMYTYIEIQLCLTHYAIRQVLTWVHMYTHYYKRTKGSLLGFLINLILIMGISFKALL